MDVIFRQGMSLKKEEVARVLGGTVKSHHMTTDNLLLLLQIKVKGQG